MDVESTTWAHWHAMPSAWRLAALVPLLFLGGVAGFAVATGFVASTHAARVVAVLIVLAAIQATRDYFSGHFQRNILLMVAATTAGGTIKPLAVEPLSWQLVILLTLLEAPLAGYGIRRCWNAPIALDDPQFEHLLFMWGIVPLSSISLSLSLSWPALITQIPYVSHQAGLLLLVLLLTLAMGLLGYWHAHMINMVPQSPPESFQTKQAPQASRVGPEMDSGRTSTKRWKAYGG